MTEYEMVDEGRLREVAQWLDAWEWPVTETDIISRAAEFGWTVLHGNPGHIDSGHEKLPGDGHEAARWRT